MKIAETQKMAKELGINIQSLKKADLIRKIQTQEGYTPCFQMNTGPCDQMACCWRRECMIWNEGLTNKSS
ncbi:MAG: hypothetical protein P4L42_02250 [Desulfocapsaceae bacterium]|nr:hypothetical protein [Desulfocapsaceae bacterium]